MLFRSILGEAYKSFIDLDKKVARFQKYVPVKKSCDEDPGGYYDCVDGFISVSEPTKEIFSEPLP